MSAEFRQRTERLRADIREFVRTTLPADKAQRLQQVIGAQTASAR